jgi:hydroxyacylglutathione hydrolase
VLFQRFVSEGLAHFSYLVGDQDRAVVIDPRRDCDVYVEAAYAEGQAITHILETHRNEDYVIGSVELANRTEAKILHSAHDDLPYQYGQPISDGEAIDVGRLRLVALHTPGHTPGHMSYVLHDRSGAPWVVFTGDTLFADEVGRTDFFGRGNLHKMTGLLYDSLFHKILPLGDGVIVCPAHGAGSVCGSGIADRPWTTVGLERLRNPRLQHTDREEFVKHVGRMLERAPYFRTVEQLNLEGPPLIGSMPIPKPLSPSQFAAQAEGAQVVDVRPLLSFAAAHVPGAVALWEAELPTYAGWFLSYDKPILLVGEPDTALRATRYLLRMGYDRVVGCLAGGMLAWHREGLPSEGLRTITVQQLCHGLDAGEHTWILDVRNEDEILRSGIPGAHHISIKQLPERLNEVPRDRSVQAFCGSGVRSMIAASLLKSAGWQNITVVLGGLAGWVSVSCPMPLD